MHPSERCLFSCSNWKPWYGHDITRTHAQNPLQESRFQSRIRSRRNESNDTRYLPFRQVSLGRDDPYARFTVTVSVAAGNYKHSKRPPDGSQIINANRGGCVVRRAALTISSNFSKILAAAGRSRFLTRSEKNSSNFSKVRDALHSSQISQRTSTIVIPLSMKSLQN